MERKKTRLNESEMKVMQIIWNAGHPITGQQVLGQITEQYRFVASANDLPSDEETKRKRDDP